MNAHKITIDAEELKSILDEVASLSERISEILEKLENLSVNENIEPPYMEDDSGFFEEIRMNIEQFHEEDDYKEIFVLEELLKEAGVPHVLDQIEDGYILTYPSPEYPSCTVIETKNTIGSDIDMLEVTGLLHEDEQEDRCAGFLLADDVFNRIMEDYETKEIFDCDVETDASGYFDSEDFSDDERLEFESDDHWCNIAE